MSLYKGLEKQPEDPILGLKKLYLEDPRREAVNLGVGAYRNAQGKPQVLSSVQKAETLLLEAHKNKEYLPIAGDREFLDSAFPLIFGPETPFIAGCQSIGGTGALHIGAKFLTKNRLTDTIYLSDPTWENHQKVFLAAGMKMDAYPYYDDLHHKFHFKGMLDAIHKMPEGSTILMQPCGHNPTGAQPTLEEWKELSEAIKQKKLLPFFDIAYQGFGKSLEEDAFPIQLFVKEGHEILVANSFSKNFGLYGERVGFLAIVCENESAAIAVESHLKQIIRSEYSSPSMHGAYIVKTILNDPLLRKEWIHELENMRNRITEMRARLISGLETSGGNGVFEHLRHQEGMYAYSVLKKEQTLQLQKNFGLYLLSNGRISLAGLNDKNLTYVTQSILSIIYTETT